MNENTRNGSRIGVISDTHGYLSDNLPNIFDKVDLIIHAGDIDDPKTLEELKSMAPVIAVRGNMDRGDWIKDLNQSELVEIGDVVMYVIHDLFNLDIDPESINVKTVISGHTHNPSFTQKGPVLYVNPGSASCPRHGNPATIAILHIKNKSVTGHIVEIPE